MNLSSGAKEFMGLYFDLSPAFNDSAVVLTALAISAIGICVTIPLMFGIVWYEENIRTRTLINQFNSLACWPAILYSVWNIGFAASRFILGPLNEAMCGLDFIIVNTAFMCPVIFIDYIIISKYILANYMRNPVALDDELLKLLAAEPAVMLSFLSQLVLFILPGRNPLRFSMCVGKIPVRYITEKVPVKINWPVYWLLLGSCAVLAGLFLKRKFDERNNQTLVITYSQSTQEQIKMNLHLNLKSSRFLLTY